MTEARATRTLGEMFDAAAAAEGAVGAVGAPYGDALARDVFALMADPGDESFDLQQQGGQGFILDFQQGRDVINLSPLGLTPWDLLPSINGPDLVLAFDGGEVVLKECAGVRLTQWDFRY
jgi:hypothetical protein